MTTWKFAEWAERLRRVRLSAVVVRHFVANIAEVGLGAGSQGRAQEAKDTPSESERKIAGELCFWLVSCSGASAWLAILNTQHSETCYVLKTNINTIYFATTTMATHFVMFFMIFWRGVKLPWEWSCSAFGRVVLRDSALSPLIVSLLKLAMVLCNTDVIRTSLNGNIIYYWLFCTMWISLGRITVDHSKAALLEELKESAGARRGELTSEIDVEETSSSISESRTSQDPSVDPTSTSEWPSAGRN
ncbi:hypothetical protein EDD16DRAFT_1903810, partial [Pisolithus croceorrhizus]